MTNDGRITGLDKVFFWNMNEEIGEKFQTNE